MNVARRGLGLEPPTIERLASEYRQRFYATRDEAAVDDWLRQKLADEGVFAEFIEVEFERVKEVVYAPLGRGDEQPPAKAPSRPAERGS